MAWQSLAEVDTLLLVTVALRYVSHDEIKPAKSVIFSTRQLLQRLIQHLRTKSSTPPARGNPDG